MEEKLTAKNIELALVTAEDGFKILKEDAVKGAIEEV